MQTHKLMVVEMILMPNALPHANKALLMRISTMGVKQIRVVKRPATEVAMGVFSEAVGVELLGGVERVFVGKDLLVCAAEVAELGVVLLSGVAFEVGPAEADGVAGGGGTVESKERERVFHLFSTFKRDAELVMRGELAGGVGL
jgi:hypothetical protein